MKIKNRFSLTIKDDDKSKVYFTVEKYTKLVGSYNDFDTKLIYIVVDLENNIKEVELKDCIFIGYLD